MPPCLFVIEWLCILMSRRPWERGWNKAHLIQSLPKPPFMIDGTRWFWYGTHYFSWGESQGLTNGKL